MPRLFSYVVARDYGFAPNPFFGCCSLATCKPSIRNVARLGDWIVGTSASRDGPEKYIVYAMRVTRTLTFNEYWRDSDHQNKKPNLCRSRKYAFGDNIYRQDISGRWKQMDSHHSHVDGTENDVNVRNDTSVDRVLISTDYRYWGRAGPKIPARFRNYQGYDICAGRGHKSLFPDQLVEDFFAWLDAEHPESGYLAEPRDWMDER